MKFKEWFSSRLKVTRFPPPEVVHKFDVIINVSDEHIWENQKEAKEYYWFPMSECNDNMGIHSLYAAMTILHNSEMHHKKVLLHCHAGVNRSVTVANAYYFMRTGLHQQREIVDRKTELEINSMFVDENGDPVEFERDDRNRFEQNSAFGHLPSINRIEKFLTKLGNELDNHKAISLDQLLLDCKIY